MQCASDAWLNQDVYKNPIHLPAITALIQITIEKTAEIRSAAVVA
jgi:hypothetical protein